MVSGSVPTSLVPRSETAYSDERQGEGRKEQLLKEITPLIKIKTQLIDEIKTLKKSLEHLQELKVKYEQELTKWRKEYIEKTELEIREKFKDRETKVREAEVAVRHKGWEVDDAADKAAELVKNAETLFKTARERESSSLRLATIKDSATVNP